MEISKLDQWFTDLTVKQKEHIAMKVLLNAGLDTAKAAYPNCTNVWIELSNDRKNLIHDHCTDSHGMWSLKENERNTLGHDF